MEYSNHYPPPPREPTSADPAWSSHAPSPRRLHWLYRLALVIAGIILLGLLATARRLEPASDGFGTHRQLGLPPCTTVALFGVRCPSCGMTTSWAHFVRGRLGQAAQANVGGALLAALASLVGPWTLASGVWGRWLIRTPTDWYVVVVSLFVLFVTVADWTVRLLLG